MKALQEQNAVINMDNVISRLKQDLGMQSDAELAKAIDVLPKMISVWKIRNTIPSEIIAKFCLEKKLDLQYILTGQKDHVFADKISGLKNMTQPEIESIFNEINNLWNYLEQAKRYELASRILSIISKYKKIYGKH